MRGGRSCGTGGKFLRVEGGGGSGAAGLGLEGSAPPRGQRGSPRVTPGRGSEPNSGPDFPPGVPVPTPAATPHLPTAPERARRGAWPPWGRGLGGGVATRRRGRGQELRSPAAAAAAVRPRRVGVMMDEPR